MKKTIGKPFSRFLVVWVGQLFSSVGSGMTAFALGIYVYNETRSATGYALVTLCAFLPSILLAPVGGALADRFDRRVMMVLGDVGCVSGLLFILAVMLTGHISLWQIYFGVTMSSVLGSVQNPAYRASATDLLEEKDFSKGIGLVQLASSAQFLISPALAGLLLAAADIRAVIFADISTFFIGVLTVLLVRKKIPGGEKNLAGGNIFRELLEGFSFVAKKRGVLLLVGILSMATFYIGLLQTLFGPMLLPIIDEKALGSMQSVAAAGMLISSLFIGALGRNGGHVRILALSLGLSGVFFSLIGIPRNMFAITAAGFFFFMTLPFINTNADVLIRKNIPNEKQGRAWGAVSVLSQTGLLVAYAVSGPLADRVFNPALEEGGAFAGTFGKLLGVGPGRGIGLMFLVSGILMITLAVTVSRSASIRALER